MLAVASRVYAADTPKESVEEKFAKRAAKLWSLQPISKPAVPVGATTSPNPIDAFVGAVYREKGLHPSAKADKLTLLRRVYFDLIGIPPTIAEQDAFLRDSSPDASQKVVDRLLANDSMGRVGPDTGLTFYVTRILMVLTEASCLPQPAFTSGAIG